MLPYIVHVQNHKPASKLTQRVNAIKNVLALICVGFFAATLLVGFVTQIKMAMSSVQPSNEANFETMKNIMGGTGGSDEFPPVLDSPYRFSDLQGCDEIKGEMQRLVNMIKNPELYSRNGAQLPRGYLLQGPPGVGKTLIAKILAGEAGVPMFAVSGSQFDEVFMGLGAARVRSLFQSARAFDRAIIFIDEIDALAARRVQMSTGINSNQTINQLLVEMDGLCTQPGIIVIGATNQASMLDEALLRPGRIDHVLTVSLPDIKGRTQILQNLLGKIPQGFVDARITPEYIAGITLGFSGAELQNLVNRALTVASENTSNPIVTPEIITEANLFVTMGPARDVKVSEAEQELSAWHEAGHALMAFLTPLSVKPIMATIRARGSSLGFVQYEEESKSVETHQHGYDYIRIFLAGSMAEAQRFGEQYGRSIGASSDIQKANKIALDMVMTGFDPSVGYYQTDQANENNNAVKALLKKAADDVRKTLKDHKKALEALARALIERKQLSRSEMIAVIHKAGYKDGPHGTLTRTYLGYVQSYLPGWVPFWNK